MLKYFLILLLILCIVPQVIAEEYLPGVIYVKYSETPSKASLTVDSLRKENPGMEVVSAKKMVPDIADSKKAALRKKIGIDRWVKITIPDTANPLGEAEKYKKLPNVEDAHPIIKGELILIPNDQRILTTQQWYHNNTEGFQGSLGGEDVDSFRAWDITTGSGVISNADTAVEWFHIDLVDNIFQNLGEDLDGDGSVLEYQENVGGWAYDSGAGTFVWDEEMDRYVFDPDDIDNIDDDGNGYVDDFIGWDFASDDNNPGVDDYTPANTEQHGTTTSGVIAAKGNNTLLIAGMCWDCEIVATRGLGMYYPEAIMYAIDNGARVVTMSWKTRVQGAFKDVMEYALANDIFLVTGAGNTYGIDPTNSFCQTEYVMCVSATTATDTIFSWSNSGNLADVGAPGGMHVTLPGNRVNYNTGTSLSSPLVGGIANLIINVNPNLSTLEIFSMIQSSTEPFINPNRYAGTGRVNAYQALLLAQESLIHGSFPVSIINAHNTSIKNTNLEVWGTIQSDSFSHAEIYYGIGDYPSSWTLWETINEEKNNEIITSLDLTNMPYNDYSIRLNVYDNNGQQANDTFSFSRGPFNIPDWPQPAGLAQSIAFVDVTGDGQNEIVYADIGLGEIVIKNLDGTNLSKYSLNGFLVIADLSFADFNGDGATEIVIPMTSTVLPITQIHIIDGNGDQYVSPIQLSDRMYGSIAIEDFNNDGTYELICGGNDRLLHVFNIDGSEISGFPVDSGSGFQGSPLVGDLDNDGQKEILILSTNMNAYLFNNDGSQRWATNHYSTHFSSPTAADFDGDGDYEIAFQNRDRIYLIDHEGNVLPGWPYTRKGFDNAFLSIEDLNLDGELEIIDGGDELTVLNYDGTEFFTPQDYVGTLYHTVTGNIDLDLEKEIISQTDDGIVVVFNHDGSVVSGYEIQANSPSGKQLFIGDVNKDGITNIGVQGSQVSILETDGTYNGGYNTHQNNLRRTGIVLAPIVSNDPYDLSGDGIIGVADVTILLSYFGNLGTGIEGDFVSDNVINILDVIDLTLNFDN